MLIKYLNDLDAAVADVMAHPGQAEYRRCLDCVEQLEAYLQSQLEPVQQKGRAIMDQLLPLGLDDLMRHTRPDKPSLPAH